jgi:hypothetical protein
MLGLAFGQRASKIACGVGGYQLVGNAIPEDAADELQSAMGLLIISGRLGDSNT